MCYTYCARVYTLLLPLMADYILCYLFLFQTFILMSFRGCVGWAGFTKHLLDAVLDKLECSVDYLQFGCVCLSWHSVLKDNQVQLNKKLRHHQAPMLLVPNINDTNDKHVWRIYNVMENKFLDSTLSIPYDKRFCGSSQGWLVFVHNDWSVSLYKPFSNKDSSIRLPCMFISN